MSYLIYRGSPLGGLIQKAESVTFDNTGTGLSASDVQDAIEEVDGRFKTGSIGLNFPRSTINNGLGTYVKIGKMIFVEYSGTVTATQSNNDYFLVSTGPALDKDKGGFGMWGTYSGYYGSIVDAKSLSFWLVNEQGREFNWGNLALNQQIWLRFVYFTKD